jgi:inorganic pyrophosphatase
LETFTLSKSLFVGLSYPHDWDFVPSTKADYGDPLDIMETCFDLPHHQPALTAIAEAEKTFAKAAR